MVYHFIKVNSVSNDARVRKWIKTFNDWGVKAKVVAFVKNEEGWKNGAVEVQTKKIWFRKLFPIGSGRIFKIIETTFKLIPIILKAKSGTTFVYHDNQLYLTILFHVLVKRIKKHDLVWDMHELPHSILLRVPFTKFVIRYIIENVNYRIITNLYRAEYLKTELNLDINFFILNNYPSNLDLNEPLKKIPSTINDWLVNKEPYALWIGVPGKHRNFPAFYRACKNLGLKMVILGKMNDETEYLNNDEDCKILFVDPAKILDYIDNAALSAVFYIGINKNNWLCEPNRLYLLMSRGACFIAGNNPPIKQSLEDYPFTTVLNSDAPNQEEVLKGVKKLLNKEKEGIERVKFGKDFLIEKNMIWEDQVSKF